MTAMGTVSVTASPGCCCAAVPEARNLGVSGGPVRQVGSGCAGLQVKVAACQ